MLAQSESPAQMGPGQGLIGWIDQPARDALTSLPASYEQASQERGGAAGASAERGRAWPSSRGGAVLCGAEQGGAVRCGATLCSAERYMREGGRRRETEGERGRETEMERGDGPQLPHCWSRAGGAERESAGRLLPAAGGAHAPPLSPHQTPLAAGSGG
jgi:hypothetical protein